MFANSGSNTISVVDVSDNKVIKTLNVGSNPCALAVSPLSSLVYVANRGSNDIFIIDAKLDSVIGTIPLNYSLIDIVISYDEKAYVIIDPSEESGWDEYIGAIDLKTNTFTDSLFVFPGSCTALRALASYSHFLVAVGEIWPTCFVKPIASLIIDIETDQVIKHNTLHAEEIILSPDEEFAYIGFEEGKNRLSIFSLDTYQIEPIVLPNDVGPTAMAISPDGKKLYIANVITKDVSVFNVQSRNIEFNIPLSSPIRLNYIS